MPYITQKQREELDVGCTPKDAGELNYCIHLLLEKYVKMKGESYQVYNDIQGALRCVADELARRRVGPYEDKKILENGDISFYEGKDEIKPTHAVLMTLRKGLGGGIVFTGDVFQCINYCERQNYPEEYCSPTGINPTWANEDEMVEILRL